MGLPLMVGLADLMDTDGFADFKKQFGHTAEADLACTSALCLVIPPCSGDSCVWQRSLRFSAADRGFQADAQAWPNGRLQIGLAQQKPA
jgi:hypothetical protein